MASRRPSYEILRELIERVDAKAFAHQVGVDKSLVYKWATDPERAEEEFGRDTARKNPMDRLQDIIRLAITEGHQDIAVEIMDGLARQFGGAYVTGKQVDAIKRVAELDLTPCQVSPRDIAALKRIAEADKDKDKGHSLTRCIECGGFNTPTESYRPYSEFCDACYRQLKAILDKEGFVIVRRAS